MYSVCEKRLYLIFSEKKQSLKKQCILTARMPTRISKTLEGVSIYLQNLNRLHISVTVRSQRFMFSECVLNSSGNHTHIERQA